MQKNFGLIFRTLKYARGMSSVMIPGVRVCSSCWIWGSEMVAANRVAAIDPPIDDTDPIRKFSIDPRSHTDLQNSLQKGSRYGISVSTPHRRYGHDCGRRFCGRHFRDFYWRFSRLVVLGASVMTFAWCFCKRMLVPGDAKCARGQTQSAHGAGCLRAWSRSSPVP